MSTIEQYKTQKIRVPIQKSYSTINPKTSQASQSSDTLTIPTMEVLPHSNSTPAQTILQTQESAISMSGLSGISGGGAGNNSNPTPESSMPGLSHMPSMVEKPELQRQGTGDSFSKEQPLTKQKSIDFY